MLIQRGYPDINCHHANCALSHAQGFGGRCRYASWMRRCLPALVAAVALLPATPARAGEGDIIVQREPGLDGKQQRELRREAGVKLVAPLPIEHTELVEPKNGNVSKALAELRADDNVVFAQPDRKVYAAAAPSYFSWTSLWGLENATDTDIDALSAWEHSLGTGTVVAVVDTGIKSDHVDLAPQIVEGGFDFVDGDPDPEDGNGHGTHVAGTIAATGASPSPVIGVAPEAKILPLRALDNNGEGFTSDIVAAFDYAGDLGVRIVNASLAADGEDPAIDAVIAEHPNTLFVVAAGNEGHDNDVPAEASYPCASPQANILCVGASDRYDQRAIFDPWDPQYSSNFGAATVDLFAPGRSIRSTTFNGYWGYMSGTSMAAPHAAGAAALALAARPDATAAQLKAALMISVDATDAFHGLSVTGGRLNAGAAVTAINGPLPTPTPEPTPTASTTPVVAPPPVVTPPAPPPPAQPAPPAPQAPPVATPVPAATTLSRVSVRGKLTTKRGKLKVRFSLSRAATVRFTITKRGNKRPLSTWTKKARPGANSVTIAHRLPTGKRLKRGSYTLSVGLGAKASSARTIRVR
ncbi:MAG TPA: S8 family serine peptidase [Solirubrobacter sp.]|nr:S8 family serine peptidase [Solirubrobacter sp.]